MRRWMVAFLLAAATVPAAARTNCDSYGRCFDFAGPDDRLDGGDARVLWQRADTADTTSATDASVAEATAAGLGDPLALAHGTVGDPLQSLSDDD